MKPKFISFIHPALRPIVLGIGLFLLFNCVLTLGITFSPINSRFNFSYGNYLPKKLSLMAQQDPQKLNVLFLGTSQTNNGFIPNVFEETAREVLQGSDTIAINSFNLGLPNNRYDIMHAYLRYHIQKYGRPKLVLIELSPSTQEVDSYYYYLPALYYRTLIENSPSQAVEFLSHPHLAWKVKKELALAAFSSLYQYRHTFSPLNILEKGSSKISKLIHKDKSREPLLEEDFSISEALMAKGWHPYMQSPNMKTPDGIRRSVQEAKAYYIDHQKTVRFDKLRLLIAYCKAQHIPVVLVSWPQHPEFSKILFQSPLGKEYLAGLNQLAQQESIPILNLNEQLPSAIDPALFADPRHLTPKGAMQFSRILAQTLFSDVAIAQHFKQDTHLSQR